MSLVSEQEYIIDGVHLKRKKLDIYQVITSVGLNLRTTPNTTDSSNIIQLLNPQTLLDRVDHVNYADINPSSRIVFYKVVLSVRPLVFGFAAAFRLDDTEPVIVENFLLKTIDALVAEKILEDKHHKDCHHDDYQHDEDGKEDDHSKDDKHDKEDKSEDDKDEDDKEDDKDDNKDDDEKGEDDKDDEDDQSSEESESESSGSSESEHECKKDNKKNKKNKNKPKPKKWWKKSRK